MKMPICWAVSLAAVVVARPARVKVMAAALSALLVACGGGGGGGGAGSEPPPAPVDTKPSVAPNYFPIVTGHRWIYSESANASAASTMVTVGGALTVDGQTGTVLRTLEAGETKATESLLLPSTSALHEIPLAGSDAFSLAVGKIQLLRLPVRAGDTFVQLDKILDKDVDLDGDGRADRLVIRAEVTVLGFENVQTPAGDFSACLHQRAVLKSSVTLSSDGRVIPIETTMDEWFAPDIGLVRRVQQESSGGRTESSTTTLSQFRLGDRRSESVPPTVLSSTPEATTAGQQSLWVKVVFSEPVDPDSMQQAFSVVDSKGQAVQGTVQVAGATAQFVPVQSWPSGRYTARIGTEAQDLLGNPLASVRTWSFDVDATAPAVVGTTPLEGAQDVDVGKPILIQFSEPVDAKTVNANTVWITDNYNPTPALLSVNGSTVTLTPTAGLNKASKYQVVVTSRVTDVQGNPLSAGMVLEFRTDPGRFGYPKNLTADFGGDGMAIGDVTGDGINDVLITVGNTPGDAASRATRLLLLPGLADGSLGAAIKLGEGSPMWCFASSVVIADLNGDGRQDAAIGDGYCGVQVFVQDASGKLVLGDYLSGAAKVLRAVDLNGDGRVDLVGASLGTEVYTVWLQDGAGHLTAQPGIPVGTGSTNDFEVADVNGDGRLDLIAVAHQGISVRLQRADRSFAPALSYSVGVDKSVAGLAVGDLNGDGRNDVAVSMGGNSPTFVGLFYQQADGSLGPVTRVSSYDIPHGVRIADLDGDGRADLLVAHQGWARVGVYMQQSNGALAAEELFQAPSGSWNTQSLAVGDVNRDGRPDIGMAGDLLIQKALPGSSSSPLSIKGRFGPSAGITNSAGKPRQ